MANEPACETLFFAPAGIQFTAGEAKGEAKNATPDRAAMSPAGTALSRFFRSGPNSEADSPLMEIKTTTREITHLASSVAVVIRGLESLSETLPAVLQVANGIAPQGVSYRSRDTLISAIDMLMAYRNHREAREAESDGKMVGQALASAMQEGIALGIEQEKQRVKEARRGRK